MTLYMRKREKEIGNKKIVIDIFTNGTLLNEEMMEFFVENEVKIGVSYDGYCGQEFRDAKTQEIVENNIRLAVKKMPKLLSIASTYSKKTIPFMYDSYKTVLDLGVKKWSFAIDTLVTNKNDFYSLDDYITLNEQINKIWEEKNNYDISINTFEKIKNFVEYAEDNKALIARPDGEICIGTTVPILIFCRVLGNRSTKIKKIF